jgi:serine protease Do
MTPLITLLLCFFSPATTQDDQQNPPRELFDRVSPSLVVVQYTYAGEAGRRELAGTGVIVRDDGLIVASMALAPMQLPDEQLVEFKIIRPDDPETELDAQFEGRDERTNLLLVKPKDTSSGKWTPLKFQDVKAKVGDTVLSVGLLSKNAGYKPYLTTSMVSASLRGPTPHYLVDGSGLGGIGSPVFNESGQAIGLIEGQPEQTPLLNDPRPEFAGPPAPSRLFVPASDFLFSLSDPPTGGAPLKLPSAGISQLSGLTKEVAEYYGLKDQPAVQIGDVIPGMPAQRAGIKSGDVIIRMNGQPLERGDQPEETWRILSRKMMRLKPGQEATFTLISAKDQPPRDITLTLAERPKAASRAKRFFAEDLGFTVREVVFEDTYERRLPLETPGVVVAFVKPGSSAQTARLNNGDLITQLNAQPLKDLEDFRTQYDAFRKERPKEAVVLEAMRGVNTTVIRIEPPQ